MVVVSAQKPFTLSYSRKGSYVVIKCYYNLQMHMDISLKVEIDCPKINRLTLYLLFNE